MVDRIKTLLAESSCDGWKLSVQETEGAQGYFILDSLEMMRGQHTVDMHLVVYKDSRKGGERYRGAMEIELFPTMTDEEILEKINRAVAGAAAVKNGWYPLPSPDLFRDTCPPYPSNFGSHEVLDWIGILAEDVFRHKRTNLNFNATEIFLSRHTHRFINSEGLEHQWVEYAGLMELVTTIKGSEEEVELFDLFGFSTYSPSWLDRKVEAQIVSTIDRAVCKPLPVLSRIPVILKGPALTEFFGFFRYQTTAETIFRGTGSFTKGDVIRRGEGDSLTLSTVPYLEGSPRNLPVDSDGIVPEEVVVIKENRVERIAADVQFGTYTGEPVTGLCTNIVVQPGSMLSSDYEEHPYLEAVVFSDFTVDRITGDFGGEIRLAYYYDGNTRTPVSGGSITGNIIDVIDTFRMSAHAVTEGSYCGPDFLYIPGVRITGITGEQA